MLGYYTFQVEIKIHHNGSVTFPFSLLCSSHLSNRSFVHIHGSENSTFGQYKQRSFSLICSTEHTQSLFETIQKSTEDIAKPSSNRGTTQRTTSELPRSKKTEKRRSLVIFGDDCSGTTFLTNLFSEDSNISAMYEPLWITRDWSRVEAGRNPSKDVRDVISALMSCHFIDKPTALKFLASTSKKWAPGLLKNPFLSPPICNKSNEETRFCPDPAGGGGGGRLYPH